MKPILAILLAVLPLICSAGVPSDSFPAGTTTIDTLPAELKSANIHVRCSTGTRGAANWGLLMCGEEGDTLCIINLSLPGSAYADDVYGGTAVLTISPAASLDARSYQTELHGTCDTYGGENSIKLVYDGVSARVYAGKEHQQSAGQIEMPANRPVVLKLHTDIPLHAARMTCDSQAAATLGYYDGSVDEITEKARLSEDRMVGLWEYLDRSMDRAKATLGGNYRFATLPNPNGGYDIIYLDGADIEPDRWTPGRVKARLRPTIFIGNYDMEWLDAEGRLLDSETNAQLSDDSAILTLRFPLQNSQIRLRKVL